MSGNIDYLGLYKICRICRKLNYKSTLTENIIFLVYFTFLALDKQINTQQKSQKVNIFQIIFMKLPPTILFFLRNLHGNKASLPFNAIPAIAPYIEHIHIQLYSFHLYSLLIRFMLKYCFANF